MQGLLIKACLLSIGLWFFNTTCDAQRTKHELNHLIYSPTPQTLPSGAFGLRASIRFGDIGGSAGGYENFYGLDELQDSYLGINYGLSDRIQIGVSRSKGSGVQRQLVNGEIKLNILNQSDSTGGMPVSVGLSHVTTGALQLASNDPESMTYFGEAAHRLSFASQVIVSRQYSSFLHLQAIGGYQHRNIAPANESNGLFYAGGAAQISLSGSLDLIFEGIYPISNSRSSELGYYPLYGGGLSYRTQCGDQWVLELTNGRGLTPNDFIPYSQSDIRAGEVRFSLTFNKLFIQNSDS